MPIVKYIPEETNLPSNVAREVKRYTAHTLVEVDQYEQYRDAAVKLDKKAIKYDAEALFNFADQLQEDAEDEAQYDDAARLKWAISNAKVEYWVGKREAAREKAGKTFNEDKWEAEQGDHNVFEASLFPWRQRDSVDGHPAVLLTMLLDRYGYKGAKNAR